VGLGGGRGGSSEGRRSCESSCVKEAGGGEVKGNGTRSLNAFSLPVQLYRFLIAGTQTQTRKKHQRTDTQTPCLYPCLYAFGVGLVGWLCLFLFLDNPDHVPVSPQLRPDPVTLHEFNQTSNKKLSFDAT
jgi:hypothetical protein